MKIKLSKIDDSAFVVREKLDQETLNELKESFREDGQWDPIIVRQKGDKYELISGHRRVQAAKEIGWTEIDANVRDLSDTEALFLALKTNLMREDMTEREQGKILHKISQDFKVSQRELAKRLGKDQKWVQRRIKLALDLTDNVAKALEENVITMMVAEIIATLDVSLQDSFLGYLLKHNIKDEDQVRKARNRFLNTTLYTIGYEGRDLPSFVELLKANGIETLLDARYSTESTMKPEFNKTILEREMERNKIKYLHYQELGVPYEWQNPYKDGAIPISCFEKYYEWKMKNLETFPSIVDTIKNNGKTAIMCYEKYAVPKRDQTIACHRSVLARIMKDVGEFQDVIHL